MTITVNGTPIEEIAIGQEMQYHPAADADKARSQAARALVVRELLVQEARRQGLESASEEQLIEELLAAEIHTPEPDEDACRRYYQSNLNRFRTEDLFEVRHILITPDPAEPAIRAKAGAQHRAKSLIRQLQDHPERFAKLAARYSACPSKDTGGSLGQIGKGQTVAEFEQALFLMDDGELAPQPLKSRYGYHVIHLDRRIPGRQLPFELVADKIADYLRISVYRRAVSQYLQLLVGRAEIDGIELSGADTPLVQ